MARPTLVVTPYHREERGVLERCIASVAAQTIPADHLLVADGAPAEWIDGAGVRHLKLDRAHADHGNTPRALGLMLGVAEGYDAIALLDADNWFEPDHVAACRAAAEADPGCDYVVARRRFMAIDGSEMAVAEEAGHVDTSCFFFRPGSYSALPYWGTMPRQLAPVCDRIFLAALNVRKLRAARCDRVTVNFHVTVRAFYRSIGATPPPGAKAGPDIKAIQRWIDALDDAELAQVEKLAGVRVMRSGEKPAP